MYNCFSIRLRKVHIYKGAANKPGTYGLKSGGGGVKIFFGEGLYHAIPTMTQKLCGFISRIIPFSRILQQDISS